METLTSSQARTQLLWVMNTDQQLTHSSLCTWVQRQLQEHLLIRQVSQTVTFNVLSVPNISNDNAFRAANWQEQASRCDFRKEQFGKAI
jgi:hypothetical protein